MTTASAKPGRAAQLRVKTAKTARWLHIYLSMVSFAIVLFFALTGLTVNHPDWFAHSVTTRELKGTLPPALVAGDSSNLVRDLRQREHLHGTAEEPRIDDREISFGYRAPGYTADAIVERADGTYTVTEVRNGPIAVLNDLHRGRDAGRAWKLLIDASAILLSLVSLTGLLILWFIYKRRASGLLIAAAGLAVCLLLYKVCVP